MDAFASSNGLHSALNKPVGRSVLAGVVRNARTPPNRFRPCRSHFYRAVNIGAGRGAPREFQLFGFSCD